MVHSPNISIDTHVGTIHVTTTRQPAPARASPYPMYPGRSEARPLGRPVWVFEPTKRSAWHARPPARHRPRWLVVAMAHKLQVGVCSLGRGLRAKSGASPGEVLLKEKPLMIWQRGTSTTETVHMALAAFEELPRETQDLIRSLHCPKPLPPAIRSLPHFRAEELQLAATLEVCQTRTALATQVGGVQKWFPKSAGPVDGARRDLPDYTALVGSWTPWQGEWTPGITFL